MAFLSNSSSFFLPFVNNICEVSTPQLESQLLVEMGSVFKKSIKQKDKTRVNRDLSFPEQSLDIFRLNLKDSVTCCLGCSIFFNLENVKDY